MIPAEKPSLTSLAKAAAGRVTEQEVGAIT